jgi:hypothetical protein
MHDLTPESFATLPLADSQVLGLASTVGELSVSLQDWQEQSFVITFIDVVGYEVIGVESEELSHGSVSTSDPLIEHMRTTAHADADGLWCFALWSAWNDAALLRVVARQYRIARDDPFE